MFHEMACNGGTDPAPNKITPPPPKKKKKKKKKNSNHLVLLKQTRRKANAQTSYPTWLSKNKTKQKIEKK